MRQLDNAKYDAQVLHINTRLREQTAELPYVTFLQQDFARFKTENDARYHNLNRLFCDAAHLRCDAVHLDDAGNFKLYKSVRSVVIGARARRVKKSP